MKKNNGKIKGNLVDYSRRLDFSSLLDHSTQLNYRGLTSITKTHHLQEMDEQNK